MAERRSLVEGLKKKPAVDPALEDNFVYGEKTKTEQPKQTQASSPVAETREGKGKAANPISRSPLTTRIRTNYAEALKRASLERQLQGVFPNTLQDILEQAVEPWLRSNGYLD
jgi:hypothetical protein